MADHSVSVLYALGQEQEEVGKVVKEARPLGACTQL